VPISSADVKRRALELGFDACGIAPAGAFPELAFLREWLDRGCAGEMTYLERTADRRADVRAVLPSALSVIVTGTVYNTDRPYSTELADDSTAHIARYAWGDDYHAVVGGRLNALLDWMRAQSDTAFAARAYVDTGPVQERVYAQYAGLGWTGKNTCLISPTLGSWLFLSEIICSLPLEPDTPALDQCGTCTLCLDACPTDALVAPGVLDATRCVSYQTIELKGGIPEARRSGIETHVYGCDICQEVCPWNAMPIRSADPAWQPREMFDTPDLTDLWRRSDAALRLALAGSAMTRAGVKRLRRNLAIAMSNSRDAAVHAALHERPPDSPSLDDPMVAEHVQWAQRNLKGQTKNEEGIERQLD
jgi:epoxyqueuosine reductase